MKRLLITAAVAAPVFSAAAVAHPGHVVEAAGHAHWLEYGALIAFVSLAAVAAIAWRRRSAPKRARVATRRPSV